MKLSYSSLNFLLITLYSVTRAQICHKQTTIGGEEEITLGNHTFYFCNIFNRIFEYTYAEASNLCDSTGGHLPYFKTNQIQQSIVNMLNATGRVMLPPKNISVWIGIKQDCNGRVGTGNFSWDYRNESILIKKRLPRSVLGDKNELITAINQSYIDSILKENLDKEHFLISGAGEANGIDTCANRVKHRYPVLCQKDNIPTTQSCRPCPSPCEPEKCTGWIWAWIGFVVFLLICLVLMILVAYGLLRVLRRLRKYLYNRNTGTNEIRLVCICCYNRHTNTNDDQKENTGTNKGLIECICCCFLDLNTNDDQKELDTITSRETEDPATTASLLTEK